MAAPVLQHFEHPVTVTVRGIIINDLGDAVDGVAVNLLFGGQPVGRSNSDDDGAFIMRDLQLKMGIHTLRASKPGFATSDETIVITQDMSNSTRLVTLRLNPAGWENASVGAATFKFHSERPNERRSQRQKYVTVEVFFGTDRKFQPVKNIYQRFGSRRSDNGELSLGFCKVSIPEGHRIGHLESPFFDLNFMDDPNRHVVLMALEKMKEDLFFQELSAKVSKTPNRDVLIFIHGYNVTFVEAVRRTAQIAFDIGFQGAPICYSWPSGGKFSKYMPDEASVEWTTPHMVKFVNDLTKGSGASTFYVIAHSMGNRALVHGLEHVVSEKKASSSVKLSQIFLAAPDIDAGVFRQISSGIVTTGDRATLYASSNDLPWAMSQQFHAYPRAGEGGDNIVVVPGIDTIDASAVPSGFFGHSYYAGTRTILSDMYELVKHGAPPPRFGLKPASKENQTYWVLQP
jgi:esterase/lipase superfamily enzyme